MMGLEVVSIGNRSLWKSVDDGCGACHQECSQAGGGFKGCNLEPAGLSHSSFDGSNLELAGLPHFVFGSSSLGPAGPSHFALGSAGPSHFSLNGCKPVGGSSGSVGVRVPHVSIAKLVMRPPQTTMHEDLCCHREVHGNTQHDNSGARRGRSSAWNAEEVGMPARQAGSSVRLSDPLVSSPSPHVPLSSGCFSPGHVVPGLFSPLPSGLGLFSPVPSGPSRSSPVPVVPGSLGRASDGCRGRQLRVPFVVRRLSPGVGCRSVGVAVSSNDDSSVVVPCVAPSQPSNGSSSKIILCLQGLVGGGVRPEVEASVGVSRSHFGSIGGPAVPASIDVSIGPCHSSTASCSELTRDTTLPGPPSLRQTKAVGSDGSVGGSQGVAYSRSDCTCPFRCRLVVSVGLLPARWSLMMCLV